MLPGMMFCLWYIHWLKNYIVDEAIITLPLNIDIMSQGSALNLHDSLVLSVIDLQIAKAFHEKMISQLPSTTKYLENVKP